MTKTELIDRIATSTGAPKNQVEKIVNDFTAVITTALKEGDTVNLIGFGAFAVSERKERAGRNPKSGEAITIAARKAVTFRPGKALKDAVN